MVEAEKSPERECRRAGRAAVRRPQGGGGRDSSLRGCMIADEEGDGPGSMTVRVRAGKTRTAGSAPTYC